MELENTEARQVCREAMIEATCSTQESIAVLVLQGGVKSEVAGSTHTIHFPAGLCCCPVVGGHFCCCYSAVSDAGFPGNWHANGTAILGNTGIASESVLYGPIEWTSSHHGFGASISLGVVTVVVVSIEAMIQKYVVTGIWSERGCPYLVRPRVESKYILSVLEDNDPRCPPPSQVTVRELVRQCERDSDRAFSRPLGEMRMKRGVCGGPEQADMQCANGVRSCVLLVYLRIWLYNDIVLSIHSDSKLGGALLLPPPPSPHTASHLSRLPDSQRSTLMMLLLQQRPRSSRTAFIPYSPRVSIDPLSPPPFPPPFSILFPRGRYVATKTQQLFQMAFDGCFMGARRLLASHLGEPGSIPGGVAPGISHVGIVPDDGVGHALSRLTLPRFGLPTGGEEKSRPLTAKRPQINATVGEIKCQNLARLHIQAHFYHRGSETFALRNQECGLAGVLSISLVPLQATTGAGCRSLPGFSTSDHDRNTACLARRSDEALGMRVSVGRIAPSLLDPRVVGALLPRVVVAERGLNPDQVAEGLSGIPGERAGGLHSAQLYLG
ncbi:hypothetical protein PR048_012179 [Dryococelus australis]|uniref:Uncharacterized protein n=1 Tax=Dryococelus australis TaxID=614101 RepID=A0ABQ9HNN1_9NEOP|nr:hypothetical protein PR048_012179 [Dryococelus australis]